MTDGDVEDDVVAPTSNPIRSLQLTFVGGEALLFRSMDGIVIGNVIGVAVAMMLSTAP